MRLVPSGGTNCILAGGAPMRRLRGVCDLAQGKRPEHYPREPRSKPPDAGEDERGNRQSIELTLRFVSRLILLRRRSAPATRGALGCLMLPEGFLTQDALVIPEGQRVIPGSVWAGIDCARGGATEAKLDRLARLLVRDDHADRRPSAFGLPGAAGIGHACRRVNRFGRHPRGPSRGAIEGAAEAPADRNQGKQRGAEDHGSRTVEGVLPPRARTCSNRRHGVSAPTDARLPSHRGRTGLAPVAL